jgi:signal transduction histidine kinase/CHASE3 domain sensor protein/CheY-like chemotaxis protein
MKLWTQLFLSFSFIFALMILIASVNYHSLNSVTKTSISHQVITEVYKIEKLLAAMVTGEHGFVITGEDKFLQPYITSAQEYQKVIKDLKLLASDNIILFQEIEDIDKKVKKWQSLEAEPNIIARKKMMKGAIDVNYLQEVLAKGVGKSLFDDMRKIIDKVTFNFRIDGNIKGEALTRTLAKNILDQETGHRGFLITGKEEFIKPFIEGQKEFQVSLLSLHLLVDNAHDRLSTITNINVLEELAKNWLKEAGLVEIEMRRQVDKGHLTQKELEDTVAQGKGKSILDKMRKIIDNMDIMFSKAENDKAKNFLLHLSKAIIDQETGQRGFIITGKESFLEPFYLGQKNFKRAAIDLRQLNSKAYDIDHMLNDINQLEGLVKKWIEKAVVPEMAARRKINQDAISMNNIQSLIETGMGKIIIDQLGEQLNNLINVELGLLAVRQKENERAIRNSSLIVLSGTILAITFGSIVMFYITRKIINQVGGEPNEIADITRKLAIGELEEVFRIVDSKELKNETGIYASVKAMISTFKKKNDDSIIQDWLKSGQNELNIQLSGELSIRRISQNSITYLAEHLDAQVGAVYIADNESRNLRLMGSFAFTNVKGLNDEIDFGQGLVGEVARTKKLISVAELPIDYTRITSASGEAPPANILVIPLLYEGRLQGVIELGTFKKFSDSALKFLESASTIVAARINTAQGRLLLNNSFKQTQKQQKELELSNKSLEEQAQKLRSSREELKIAKVHAENASRTKSEFLANMSHEIRTPLNAIIGYIEFILDDELTADHRSMLQTVQGCSNSLLELINEILDFAKIEAGKLTVEKVEFDLADLLFQVNEQFLPKLISTDLQLHVQTNNVHTELIGDSNRIKQVLINLIGNAVKFTDSGEIVTSLELISEDEDEVNFTIKVCDSGIGISQDQLENIFEDFKQADGSITRKYGGTGLGLSITRKLIKLMDSEINVTSEVGKGTEFTFQLTLPKALEKKEKSRQNNEFKDKKLLLLDDNLTTIEIVKDLCFAQSIHFSSCFQDECAKQIQEADIVLISSSFINTGIKAQLGEFCHEKNKYLITLNANLETPNFEFDKKIFKPIRPDYFYAALKQLFQPESVKIINKVSQASNQQKSRILLVEDNKTNQILTKKILCKMGHEVLIANNGQEAVDMVIKDTFDLIFMDMQMPVMGGIEATRIIRQSGDLTPIIALTANALDIHRDSCKEAGMSDFTTKPIRLDVIKQFIQKYTNQA